MSTNILKQYSYKLAGNHCRQNGGNIYHNHYFIKTAVNITAVNVAIRQKITKIKGCQNNTETIANHAFDKISHFSLPPGFVIFVTQKFIEFVPEKCQK